MLTLGQINFGLGVDTKALQTATDQIRAFGSQVDRVARSNGKGMRQLEAGLRTQEKAMTQMLQNVATTSQNLRKAKAPDDLFNNLNKDLNQFIGLLDKGKVKPLEFQRAMIMMTASLNSAKRGLKEHQQAVKGLGENISPVTRALQSMAQAAVLITGPLGGVAARFTTLATVFAKGGVGLTALVAGMAAAGYTVGKLGSAATRTAIEFDRINNLLKITEGTTGAASRQFDELKDLALRTGTSIGSLAGQYARMKQASQGTALEGEKFRKIFDGVTLASAKFQLTTEETEGVLRAFEQIISKGTVQAEELRGQLGDRLVGAFNIAAQAMGKTTEQLNALLKAGDLAAADFLPKFVEALLKSLGLKGTESVDTLQAAINNLNTSVELFNNKVNQTLGIGEAFRNILAAATNTVVFFTENLETVLAVIAAVGAALLVMSAGPILTGLGALAVAIINVTAAIWAMNAAALANPVGALLGILARIGLVAVGATAGFMAMKTALSQTKNEVQSLSREIDEYIGITRLANRTQVQQTDDYIEKLQAQRNALELTMRAEKERLDQMGIGPDIDPKTGKQKPTTFLGLETDDPLGKALRKPYEDANQASIKLYIQEMKLKKLRADQNKEILKQAEAHRVAQRIALMAIDNQIHRTEALANANKLGTGSAQALENAYSRMDAIEKFTKELKEVEKDQHKITQKVNEFAEALNNLEKAKAVQTLREYSIALGDMQRRIDAMQKGPAQLAMTDKILGDEATIRQWREQLLEAGESVDSVDAKLKEMAKTLETLRNTERLTEIAKEFRELNREMQTMQGEIAAMANGPDALERFQRMDEVNRKVEELARRLYETGVPIEEARKRALEYGNTLQQHVNATALQEHLQTLYDMQDQIKVYKTAAGYIKDYNLSFQDGEDVANFALQLQKLGLAQEQVNALVARFVDLRKLSNEAQAKFEGMRQAIEGVQNAWSDAFDGIGDSLTDSLFEGKSLLEGLANTAKQLGKQLVDLFLQLAVINPIKNSVLNPTIPYPTVTPSSGWLFGKKAANDNILGGMSNVGGSALNPAYVSVVNGTSLFGGGLGGNADATTTISSAVERGLTPTLAEVSKNQDLIADVIKANGTSGIGTIAGAGAGVDVGGTGVFKMGGNFNQAVDSRLLDIIKTAAKRSGMDVTAISGFRPGDPRFHGSGNAIDVSLKDAASGYRFGNYQNAGDFRTYEKFAQNARMVQMEKYPELADDFRWGGYFSGKRGKYGAMDTMHFDLGGSKVGMGGGSWAGGLNDKQRALFPGAESIGFDKLKAQTDAATSSLTQMQTASQAAAVADQGKQVAAQTAAVADQQKAVTGQQAAIADQTKAVSTQASAVSEQGLAASAQTAATSVGTLGVASQTAATATATSAGGGGLFSWFGKLFGFAKGGAWSNGVQFARKGHVMSGPTLFGTSSGPVVGGEAGTEAILPLQRDAQGNLGVKADGGGRQMTFVQNIYARDMKSAQQSKYQMAANAGRILRKGAKFA